MEKQLVHAAAVEAVYTWTRLACRAASPVQVCEASRSADATGHETAVSLTAQWIHEALANVQHHQAQLKPNVLEGKRVPAIACDTPVAQATWTIHGIQLIAESVANTVIEFALAQLCDSSVPEQVKAQPPTDRCDDASEAPSCVFACSSVENEPNELAAKDLSAIVEPETCNRITDNRAESRSLAAVNFVTTILERAVHAGAGRTQEAASLPPPDEENARTRSITALEAVADHTGESRSHVANAFVASLLDNAIRHTVTSPTAAPSPSRPQPSPPPPLEMAITILAHARSVDIPTVKAPPTPNGNTPTPPVVLAAVKPPKHGTGRLHREPERTIASSPRETPAERSVKTADHHKNELLPPVAIRTPRTSPRPVSHDHEASQSPPRLRKLEEYLELHPVGRAKKIYRPRRPQHSSNHHPPSGSHSLRSEPHHANGYEAEHEGSGDDKEESGASPALPRVKLAPLRGTANANHPVLPVRTKPGAVDRPDHLGLLNKPKKRSGYCQQCGYEGRSCKVSDCLKHQPLR